MFGEKKLRMNQARGQQKADDDFLPYRTEYRTVPYRTTPQMCPSMLHVYLLCVAFGIFGLSEDSECQQVAVQHRQRQRSLAPC